MVMKISHAPTTIKVLQGINFATKQIDGRKNYLKQDMQDVSEDTIQNKPFLMYFK